jgi:hypothetical protein
VFPSILGPFCRAAHQERDVDRNLGVVKICPERRLVLQPGRRGSRPSQADPLSIKFLAPNQPIGKKIGTLEYDWKKEDKGRYRSEPKPAKFARLDKEYKGNRDRSEDNQ